MSTALNKAAKHVKKALPARLWRPLRGLGTAIVTPIRFAFASGHFRSSLNSKALSRTGEPLPWYTYPAIDFLRHRRFEGKRILEFGGGQSTLWWAARADKVLTVDSDEEWADYVRQNVGENVAVHYVPLDRESRTVKPIREVIAASGIDKFDIIVIDGHLREELVAVAFDHLAANGAIIMDNAEGYSFANLTADRDCRRIEFYGLSPGTSLQNCTSMAWVDDCFLNSPKWPIPIAEMN